MDNNANLKVGDLEKEFEWFKTKHLFNTIKRKALQYYADMDSQDKGIKLFPEIQQLINQEKATRETAELFMYSDYESIYNLYQKAYKSIGIPSEYDNISIIQ